MSLVSEDALVLLDFPTPPVTCSNCGRHPARWLATLHPCEHHPQHCDGCRRLFRRGRALGVEFVHLDCDTAITAISWRPL